MRRKKGGYFPQIQSCSPPLRARIKRRLRFSEADVMGIAWHGRYASFFEEAWAELARQVGLSYIDFREADLRAPIVQLHVDYHSPLLLDEEFVVTASLVWTDGARLNTEYIITRMDDTLVASGYTVQMFIDAATGEVCFSEPDLLERFRRRWRKGDFKCLETNPS